MPLEVSHHKPPNISVPYGDALSTFTILIRIRVGCQEKIVKLVSKKYISR